MTTNATPIPNDARYTCRLEWCGMSVASELPPIERACGHYVGIAEQAECALVALAAVGVTGPAATRIAASAAADVAERYNAAVVARYTTDYLPSDRARNLHERYLVIASLRAMAAAHKNA